MSKAFYAVVNSAKRLWTRFHDFLGERRDRHVAEWGSSLQYKRAYTNPDAAKRARKSV